MFADGVIIMIVLFAGIPTLVVVLYVLRAHRQKREIHERVENAIEKITADGKIEGPKGVYRPRRWSRKWINYSHSLPMPRGRYEMSGGKLPRIERDE